MEIGIVGRARANGGAVSEGVGEGAGAALAELIHAAELRRASIRRLRHRRVAGGWRVILLGRLQLPPGSGTRPGRHAARGRSTGRERRVPLHPGAC